MSESDLDPATLPMGRILSAMRPGHWVKIITVFAGFVVGIYGLGYWYRGAVDAVSKDKPVTPSAVPWIVESGLSEVIKGGEIDQIVSDLKAAKSRIRIQSTWLHDTATINQALIEAVRNHHVTIDIYLLHPDSKLLPYRATAIGYPPKYGRNRVLRSLNDLHALFSNELNAETAKTDTSVGTLRVWLYDTPPAFLAIQVDQHFRLSFYIHGQLSPFGLVLVAAQPGWLFESINHEVNLVTSTAERVLFDSAAQVWRTNSSMFKYLGPD